MGRELIQNDVHDLPSDNSAEGDFDPNISEDDVADHVEGSLMMWLTQIA